MMKVMVGIGTVIFVYAVAFTFRVDWLAVNNFKPVSFPVNAYIKRDYVPFGIEACNNRNGCIHIDSVLFFFRCLVEWHGKASFQDLRKV